MSGTLYRIIMRIAHHYNWHYAPPIYPEGDTQLWCKWCGFRETTFRRGEMVHLGDPRLPHLILGTKTQSTTRKDQA